MTESLQIRPVVDAERDGIPTPVPYAATAPVPGTTGSTPADRGPTSAPADARAVSAAVDTLNQQMLGAGRSLRFNVDPQASLLVVSVVDESTGEVVRQLPGEDVVEAARRSRAGQTLTTLLQATA